MMPTRRAFCLTALAALAACGRPAPRMGGPIASTTRFEAARFAGPWVMRAAIGPAPSGLSFQAEGGQLTGYHLIDGAGGFAPLTADRLTARYFTATGGQFWVLWVDDDYRTALLGAPDRRFAWIIDRNTQGGADRIDAAFRLAQANGYDPRAFGPSQR